MLHLLTYISCIIMSFHFKLEIRIVEIAKDEITFFIYLSGLVQQSDKVVQYQSTTKSL